MVFGGTFQILRLQAKNVETKDWYYRSKGREMAAVGAPVGEDLKIL